MLVSWTGKGVDDTIRDMRDEDFEREAEEIENSLNTIRHDNAGAGGLIVRALLLIARELKKIDRNTRRGPTGK